MGRKTYLSLRNKRRHPTALPPTQFGRAPFLYACTKPVILRFMPIRHSSIESIRAELTWVTETPDPNRCGCRHVLCCEREGHAPGACGSSPTTKLWTFRWEYFCANCREYHWCGSKVPGAMVAR